MSTDSSTAETDSHEQAQALGIRDRVLILPSVICSHIVAEEIADAVDGCVSTPHDHGCAQLGRDNERTRQTLISLGNHPNVAGSVVVGLGCEHVQSDSVATALEERNVDVRELSIQGVGGTEACVERGSQLARELREATSVDGTASALSELTVGIVSTDLDEPTRTIADPLVGEFVDRLVGAGGRALVAGTERVAAYPAAVSDRTVSNDPEVEDALADVIKANQRGPSRTPRLRAQVEANPFETITRAWGSHPIDEILEYGGTPKAETRVGFVDTASRFEEAATALAAAGAQLIVHVTNDGIPTGHPIVPVVKVSGSRETLEVLGDDIDVDAREETVSDLVATINRITAGERSCAERHGVTSFAIERVGPSM